MIRGTSDSRQLPANPLPDSALLHLAQVEQTMRLIPLLMVFHGIAAAAIHAIAGEADNIVIQKIWPLLCALVALGFGGLYLSWYRGALRQRVSQVQGLIELLGLVLGFVWAMPAAAYAVLATTGPILPMIAISLTMMGVASIALLRAPIAIVVFLSLMTAALARSAWLALGDHSIMGAAVILIYGLILLSLTIISHRQFLRHATATLQLQQQRDFMTLLLTNLEQESHDWLWETDRVGRLVYASPRLAEHLGLSEDVLRQDSFRAHLASRVDAASWPTLERTFLEERDFKPIEVKARTVAGDRVWLLTGKALLNNFGVFTGFRGVGRDLTAQHRAESKTSEAVEAATTASAAKSRFLSVMSHELRTPIHSIVGFAELLTKDRDVALNDKARKEFSGSILDQALILQGLINDMLDATRLERGTIKLVEQDMDAAEIVELAINAMRVDAERAQVTVMATLADGVELAGDMARLKQAVTNIMSNAIKFSVENGIVHVEMRKNAGGGLAIEVRDAGVGVAQQEIERLFEPFSQADDSMTRRFNGLGLGLAIARQIMRLHDGNLTLVSAEGAGTTATLTLPAARVRWRKTQVAEERLSA